MKPLAPRPAPDFPEGDRDTLRDPLSRGEAEGHATPTSAATPSEELPRSDRYRIEALLGAGGMGKVFRAFDLKLQRKVALKFLRSGDAALERRFLREAQNQARVDHENVCKVYEVGQLGGAPYIAMQLVEGRTLGEAARTLTLREKVAALRATALGVHAAHKEGLIHRDLKPANILLEQAEDAGLKAYVTDFGLSRDLGAPGNTLKGAIVGTPQYMAPEQARGEHAKLDARTDVYALGAMLYEVLVGQAPFSGGSHLEILYRMMHEEPSPPRQSAKDVSKELEAIALKCLEKDPARRYPSARAFADDLGRYLDGKPVEARPPSLPRRARRWMGRHRGVAAAAVAVFAAAVAQQIVRAVRGRTGVVTVAVADFDNATGEEGLDGLSGMLITSLEQSHRLSVLTRSRMLDLLREDGRPGVARIDESLGREISRRANASALLLATIRKFDALYQIDLKVLDPRTSEYVLAAKAEGRGKGSVPRLIDQLTDEARRALNDLPASGPAPRVAEVATPSLEAYQHYFRGQELFDRLKLSEARREFGEAVAIDPGFAVAWFRLAYALQWLHDGPRARAAADKALTLIDRMPEKERYLVRGVRAGLYNRGREAYESFKACFERFPQEKECAFQIGDLLFHGGYMAPSIAYLKTALALDPSMERALQHLAWAYQLEGRNEELLEAAQRYVARVGSDDAYGHLGRAFAAAGDYARARETFRRAAERFPRSALPLADQGTLAAFQGKLPEAEALLRPLVDPARAPSDRCLGWLTLGGVYLLGGKARAASEALDRAAIEAGAIPDGELQSLALAERGLVEALYLRNPELARRIATDGRALGIPEANFGFLYPFLGDLELYGALLRGVGDPLADDEVNAFRLRAQGRFGDSAQAFHALEERSPYRDFIAFVEADAEGSAGHDARAIELLSRARQRYPAVIAPGLGPSVVLRARSELMLSQLYERSGNRALALAHDERFLRSWKDADPELPELAEARTRLARLHGASPAIR